MKARSLFRCLGAIAAVIILPAGLAAQPRPGTAQPGQVERQLERPPEPTARGATIQVPATTQQAPGNAAGIHFTLTAITLDGATVYKPERLRALWAPLLGTDVTLARIYALVDALTARYRNDGYILSQVVVPAQAIENGAVRLQAVEGFIADVQVQGGTPALQRRAQAYGRRIKARKPLTSAVLERQVLLLNDLPGVQARAVLAPGSTRGAATLVLQLAERRAGAEASVDNRGSRAQGRQRVFGDLDLHNLLGGASLTEVREVTTGTRELSYTALSHDQYIGPGGLKVTASASYVYSKPQELSVVPLDLITRSQTGTLGLSLPLLRSRARNVYLRGSFSAFDSTSDIFGVRDTADRLRTARAGATIDAADRLGGVTIADLEYSRGFKGMGASRNGDLYLSRATGRADFRKLTLYAARAQALPGAWSVLLAANGQYAFTDLLAPELFGVGGEQFGRGYDPSELVNDHGAALKLDLRYTHVWAGRRPVSLAPYIFGDTGRVWQRTRQPGLDPRETASSAGGGVRLSLGTTVSGFVEVAKPLDHRVGQENNRRPRIYAGLSIK